MTAIQEMGKRLAQAGQDDEPLPDPADAKAETALLRERATTDDQIREAIKKRDESSAARTNVELEQEAMLRKLPAAKRALAESQADLTDYETDSREAAAGGVDAAQGRAMNEQVWLYRLRVAENQAALELLKYQASDLP